MVPLYVLSCAVFDLVAGAYDAYETSIGLKKGVGVEGNALIKLLSGSKPKTWALIFVPIVFTAGFTALSLTHNPALVGGSVGALVASGASHIQAGLKWKFLNNGGQIDRQKPYTWWQKLLGMGWD